MTRVRFLEILIYVYLAWSAGLAGLILYFMNGGAAS